MGKNFLVIGDIHAPWIHKPTFRKILEIAEKIDKIDYIIQIGDAYDFFSFSRFPRSYNLITPSEEIQEGRLCLEEVWRSLKKRHPRSMCFQLKGNHSERITKKLYEKFPEIASLVDLSHLWKFDGVTSANSARDQLILENIVFQHGHLSQLGAHAKFNMKRTVCGHTHRGGVIPIPTIGGGQIWELNVGYVADPEAEPLKYNPQKFINWTHGVGLIDEFGPRFISL